MKTAMLASKLKQCYSPEMDLHQYVAVHSQSDLAKLLGVAPAFVNQWVSGRRPIPLPTCVEIEQKTGGAVTRKELRPDDWHLIWPELAQQQSTTTEPATAGAT